MKKNYRFYFAIVSEDKAGQVINLFKIKKQAEIFLKELKKLNKNYEKKHKNESIFRNDPKETVQNGWC